MSRAVSQLPAGPLQGRLVAARVELEGDLQMRSHVAAVRVQVHRVRHHAGVGGQQAASLRVEDVGVAAHLVHRPPGGRLPATRCVLLAVLAEDLRAPDHVVEDVAAADGVARFGEVVVVDLPELERGHVPVLVQADRRRLDLTPPVRRLGPHGDLRQLHDQVRLADGPAAVAEVPRGRELRQVAGRRAAVDPFDDGRDLRFAQGGIVLVPLDADAALHVPRRHDAGARPQGDALLDRPAPRDAPARRSAAASGRPTRGDGSSGNCAGESARRAPRRSRSRRPTRCCRPTPAQPAPGPPRPLPRRSETSACVDSIPRSPWERRQTLKRCLYSSSPAPSRT